MIYYLNTSHVYRGLGSVFSKQIIMLMGGDNLYPVNIYALTRVSDPVFVSKLERQMSGRNGYLKIRKWEIEGLKAFCGKLCGSLPDAAEYDFYYSFVLPKLGKEFDLLRICSDCVINIELKSGNVTDEVIRRQLVQNRAYLSMLGLNMYFFTYVSGSDRLVRLTHSDRLVEASWEELRAALEKSGESYKGEIEDLFKEERYLISPLTDPEKFLRKEYFLTSQQRDIKKQIVRHIRQASEEGLTAAPQGFTGFPGTGKTILLYDIAMELSKKEPVCIFHLGSYMQELAHLDRRLKRIDFYYGREAFENEIKTEYRAILVDEGHNMDRLMMEKLTELSAEWNAPIVISYDREDALSLEEQGESGSLLIEAMEGFEGYRLTNRIRLNTELSGFIRAVMHYGFGERRRSYPSVSVAYASDEAEATVILGIFEKDGYEFIRDTSLEDTGYTGRQVSIAEAEGREYPKVVMLMDESFYYDGKSYLRHGGEDDDAQAVRNLFRGLSRAKEKIAVVVKGNEEVFGRLMSVLQPL